MALATGALSDRTTFAIREVLAGRRRGWRAALPFAGPAVIASIAYMDPGNFATNIQAGASFGYGLLWVVLLASGTAMLFQALSAKIGIVTNRNLAELCRAEFAKPGVLAMWLVSEVAAMATDLAEFLGGAIGLSLLLGLPLIWGMLVTGVITYALLQVTRNGFRSLELMIGSMVGLIGIAYIAELFIVPADWRSAALQTIMPHSFGSAGWTLAAGIVGATVMPHALFLHSGLHQGRAPAQNIEQRHKLVFFSNREVVIALTFAALVNAAMVIMAAAAFHKGHPEIAEIQSAYRTLIPLFGLGAGVVFLASLMLSGISSSVVGTMAGQMIMQGFTGARIPIWVRRSIVMIPSFVVVASGLDPTRALIWSQVILSMVLPIPLIALVVLSRRRSVMGDFAAGPFLTIVASTLTGIIIAMNAIIIIQALGYLPA